MGVRGQIRAVVAINPKNTHGIESLIVPRSYLDILEKTKSIFSPEILKPAYSTSSLFAFSTFIMYTTHSGVIKSRGDSWGQ